jgi:hypothetical protein
MAAAMALTNVANTVRDASWTTESMAQNPWDVHRPSKNIQRGDRVYFLQIQIPSRHRPPLRCCAIHLAAHTLWFGVSHLDCQEKKSQVRRRCRTGARFDAASSYGGSSIIAETRYLEWTFSQRFRGKKSPSSSSSSLLHAERFFTGSLGLLSWTCALCGYSRPRMEGKEIF